jgi:hypothetical protein
VGPAADPQLLYVLLDRSLIFYSGIINWAHGRRGLAAPPDPEAARAGKQGFTAGWSRAEKQTCAEFFQGLGSRNPRRRDRTRQAMVDLVTTQLEGCVGPLA